MRKREQLNQYYINMWAQKQINNLTIRWNKTDGVWRVYSPLHGWPRQRTLLEEFQTRAAAEIWARGTKDYLKKGR